MQQKISALCHILQTQICRLQNPSEINPLHKLFKGDFLLTGQFPVGSARKLPNREIRRRSVHPLLPFLPCILQEICQNSSLFSCFICHLLFRRAFRQKRFSLLLQSGNILPLLFRTALRKHFCQLLLLFQICEKLSVFFLRTLQYRALCEICFIFCLICKALFPQNGKKFCFRSLLRLCGGLALLLCLLAQGKKTLLFLSCLLQSLLQVGFLFLRKGNFLLQSGAFLCQHCGSQISKLRLQQAIFALLLPQNGVRFLRPFLQCCQGGLALRNAFLQAFLFGAQGFCFVYLPLLLCQQCHFLLECDFCRFLFRIKPLRSCPQPFTACAERFLRQEQLFPCNLRLLGCPSQSRACRFLLRLFLLPFRLRNGIFRQRRLMGMVRCAADRASHPLREVFR